MENDRGRRDAVGPLLQVGSRGLSMGSSLLQTNGIRCSVEVRLRFRDPIVSLNYWTLEVIFFIIGRNLINACVDDDDFCAIVGLSRFLGRLLIVNQTTEVAPAIVNDVRYLAGLDLPPSDNPPLAALSAGRLLFLLGERGYQALVEFNNPCPLDAGRLFLSVSQFSLLCPLGSPASARVIQAKRHVLSSNMLND